MIKNRTFLFLSLLLFYACSNNSNNSSNSSREQAPEASPTIPAVEEDEVILQLSSYLIASPQNQAERDQNTITNYAIDKLIPLERTASGLFYHILDTGAGELLQWGDYISAHYKGYFLDGQVFDSSYRRDKPLEFYIGNMVPGWNEGLQLIRPGGKILLLIPSALGYGEKGFPDGKGGFLVPPNTVLAFEVEVLEKLK